MQLATEEFLQNQPGVDRPALAPWPHTVFLICVLGLWATYGALNSRLSPSASPLWVRYISSIVIQSLLVGSTVAGLYHRREFFNNVFDGTGSRSLRKDLVTGAFIYIAGVVVLVAMRLALRPTPLSTTYKSAVVHGMLPQTPSNIVLWLVVSIAAGTSEEFIFRGYLLQQFAGWSRSFPVSIGLSALIFGCMHLYQGTGAAIGITALGVLYGVCAWRIGNLRAVMFAHLLQDFIAGLFYYLRHT